MFIFSALCKEVQLVLYESICVVRTQSELSLSPALLVSARLYTQTVFTQTILRQQLSLTIAFNNAQVTSVYRATPNIHIFHFNFEV